MHLDAGPSDDREPELDIVADSAREALSKVPKTL
jgi:hypothetical protein